MSENSGHEPPFTVRVDGKPVEDRKHPTLIAALAAQRELAKANLGRKVQIFDSRGEEVSFRRDYGLGG
jgi:hypothetical protein